MPLSIGRKLDQEKLAWVTLSIDQNTQQRRVILLNAT